MNKRKSPIEPV